VVTEEPPLLSCVMEEVSPALEAAVESALTSDLSRRCESAAELRRRLLSAWTEGDGIATHEEVSELVHRVVGPRLVKRGTRVAELREVRSRRSDMPLPDAVTELTMTAPRSGGKPRDAEPAPGSAPSEALPVTVVSSALSGAFAARTVTGSQVTEASAVLARLDARRSRRRNVASGIVAGVVIAALVGVAVTLTGTPRAVHEARPAAPAPARSPAPVPRDERHTEAAPVAPADTPPVAEPVVDEPSPRTAAPGRHAATSSLAKRAGVQNVERAPHPEVPVEAPRRAPPRSTAPKKLASDPYGGG
jgi:hypothetical protein